MSRQRTQLTCITQSKHLINVFKEAKAAYLDRKIELAGGRGHETEFKPRKSHRGDVLDEDRAGVARSHSRPGHGSSRPSAHHRHSSSARHDSSTVHPSSQDRHAKNSGYTRSHKSATVAPGTLIRRHSAADNDWDDPAPRRLATRSMTSPVSPSPHIDMNLAYGPIPPPLPVSKRGADEVELKSLVHKVKGLLAEADCLQHSVSAIINTLQKNPDAMAAVGLTLAEISRIVTKMAPNMLTAVRSSSPTVFALLASPQFLIAGGMAVGVTIVAFGGFKIIKKIRAKNAMEVQGMDEMMEIGGDVNRIDNWRRGIAQVEDSSIGTSVDGEFITPHAAQLARLNLEERRPTGLRRSHSEGDRRTSSSKGRSDRGSDTRSKSSSKLSSTSGSKTTSRGKKEKKVSSPSPLRLMFS